MTLLVATHNQGKKREFEQLLAPLNTTIGFPHDLGIHPDVREDGTTYAENAYKKAKGHARASGLPTLADDSGLEVDMLGGAPGIHSARYVSGSDSDRVAALLSQLRGVPWEKRTARFRCVVVIVTPRGDVHQADRPTLNLSRPQSPVVSNVEPRGLVEGPALSSVEGVCEGIIAFEPAGAAGFGYDPIFYLPAYGCTMAQLSPEEKNRISHRALAVQAALPDLKHLLEK